jgi:hypothetical protein
LTLDAVLMVTPLLASVFATPAGQMHQIIAEMR